MSTLLPVILPWFRAARLHSCYLLAEALPDTGQPPQAPGDITIPGPGTTGLDPYSVEILAALSHIVRCDFLGTLHLLLLKYIL